MPVGVRKIMRLNKLLPSLFLASSILAVLSSPAKGEAQMKPEKSSANSSTSINPSQAPPSLNSGQSLQAVKVIPQLNEIQQPFKTVEILVQSPIVEIGRVRVEQASKGLEVILETTQGEQLQVVPTRESNIFSVDIQSAQLRLPSGQPFSQSNPIPGIASITVTNVNAKTVRLVITGTQGIPSVELFDGDEGLIFSVTSAQQQAATPPQGETQLKPDETPTQSETPSKPETENQLETPGTPTQNETPSKPEQPSAENEEPIELVVTATRTEENLQNVPRTVTIIKREQIDELAPVSRDLSDIIGKLTPGAGPPTGTIRNTTVRGRPPQILIDGIPVTSNDSNAGYQRDLRSIAPNAVERIEIVRGPSAVYGDGATGGVINIITRKPSDQKLVSETQVGIDASGNLRGDSFGNFFSHSISVNEGNFDLLALFSRRSTGIAYDAEGSQIPFDENTAETQTLQALGKVGVRLDDNQRLQLTANLTRDRIDPSITSDLSVDQLPFRRKARGIPFDATYIGADPPQSLNYALTLDYGNQNIFGSKLNAQAYYRYTRIVPTFFDGRSFNDPLGISNRDSIDDKWGGRLQVETPLFKTANFLWGVDYSKAHLEDQLSIFDADEFDASNRTILREIEKRTFYPRFSIENLGLFGQLQWEVSPQWLLSGGLRYERFGIDVPDFTNQFLEPIEGGNRTVDDVVFNGGIVFKPSETISVYANFAQGFSLPPIARILFSNATTGFRFDRDVNISEPQKVDNYEIGIRGNWSNVQASIAGFYSESELGTTLVENPALPGTLLLARAPQRNYGVEAAIDWQATKSWQFGGSLTWQEGENDIDGDGDFEALNSGEVSPIKLTAYLQNQTTPGWRNRLQTLYVGDRNRGFEDGSDNGPIRSYFVLDYISSIKIGAGTIDIGVENLLNNQYTPALNQFQGDFLGNSYRFPARGTTLRLNYRINW
jgi:iron complex outermembrane receptor protein